MSALSEIDDAAPLYLRAIFYPKSKSAKYTAEAAENHYYTSRKDLPLQWINEEGVAGGSRRRPPLAIVLKQSNSTEKFTFGSSSLSDIVLRHAPCASNEEECYINFYHLQCFPDPDSSAIALYNHSTIDFGVRSSMSKVSLQPGREIRLSPGLWSLSLGKGFDFRVQVLDSELYPEGGESLIATLLPIKAKSHGAKFSSGKKEVSSDSRRRKTKKHHDKKVEKCEETIVTSTATRVVKVHRDGMIVVIKLWRKSDLRMSAETWRNEVQILSRLHHPGVVRLLSYNARRLSIDLEYMGYDLAKFVDSEGMSQFSELVRTQIWLDISKALEYIHDQGVIHLDVKPHNILLQDNQTVLCDFGFSVRTAGLVSSDGGTPSYMPPEYLLADRGQSGDVWAFGITLLFVYGLMPLPRENWIIAHVRHDPKVQKQMLDYLRKIYRIRDELPSTYSMLGLMLQNNPQTRITASEMVTALNPNSSTLHSAAVPA